MGIGKILVVEDDLIIQLFICKTLERAGYEVIGEARSGQEAFEILSRNTPDLILLDISLVGPLSGIDIAHIVNGKYKIPFIFMTGNSDESTLEKAKEADPLGFIFKPIDDNHLLKKLKEFEETDIKKAPSK